MREQRQSQIIRLGQASVESRSRRQLGEKKKTLKEESRMNKGRGKNGGNYLELSVWWFFSPADS